MLKHDRFQQFTLANFLDSVFIPAKTALQSVLIAQNQMLADYHISAFFESFWWLGLGVEIEYFSEEQARKILLREFIEVPAFKSFFSRHPNLFPGELVTALDAALTVKRFFDALDNHFFYSPETLRVPFQLLLMEATDFARDPLTRYFISVLNFGSQNLWNGMMRQEIRPSKILSEMRPDREDYDDDVAWIAAGFLRSVQHIMARQSNFDDLNKSAETDEHDGYLLARRVRNIEMWRLNFHDATVHTRFEEIGAKVNRVIAKEANATSLGEAETSFASRLIELMDFWKGGKARTNEE